MTIMVRAQLSEQQWSKVDAFLCAERGAGRPAFDDRKFIEAVLWWRRTGVPWRDLPSDFGPWKTVFNRFDRWAKMGKWQRLFFALQTDRDDEWHSLDSTINRAHQHLFASLVPRLIQQRETREYIEQRRRFGGRPAGRQVIAALVRL